jgi:hypothetical protein
MAHEVAPILTPFAQVAADAVRFGMLQKQQEMEDKRRKEGLPAPRPRPTNQPGPQLVGQATAPQTTTPPVAEQPDILTEQDFAKEVLGALEDNESAESLAAWVVSEYSAETFEEMKKVGKEKLLADIRSAQGIQSALSTYDVSGALDKLITEFLAWTPDEDEDDEPEPPAAAQNTNPWIQPATTVEVQ